MNKQIGQVAKTVRRLLEDEAILLDEINREILEDCYLTLERIAVKRPLTNVNNTIKPSVAASIDRFVDSTEQSFEGQIK